MFSKSGVCGSLHDQVLRHGIGLVVFLVTLGTWISPLWADTLTKEQRQAVSKLVAEEVRKVIKGWKEEEKGREEGMPEWSKSLIVSPAVVSYGRGKKVLIAGAGFEPGQELSLYVEMGGVLSDISYLVKPAPVPNERGAFASVWTLEREIRHKLLEPTYYTIRVVDEESKTLRTAPFILCDVNAQKAHPVCKASHLYRKKKKYKKKK